MNFNGIQGKTLENVQARLHILVQSQGELTASKIHSIYNQATQDIQTAMQPYGYFTPRIQSKLIQQKSHWTANFSIDPGKPIIIKQLLISIQGPGKSNSNIRLAVDNFLKIGGRFDVNDYQQAKIHLFHVINNQGYINAHIENNKVVIDLKQSTASIILKVQTEEQYYFGDVIFNDNPYSNDFLKRMIHFSPNSVFSSEKLIALQQKLSSNDYFQHCSVTPDIRNARNHHIPIRVDIAVAKAKKYSVGIGYGTYTGARLSAGLSLRRISNSGQHFDAQLKLSSVLSELAAKYYIPGNNPLTDHWLLGLNYQRFLPKNGSSSSGTLTAGYTTMKNKLQTNIDINYLVEHYKIRNKPAEISEFLYPHINLTYNDSNDLINPTEGKLASLTLRGASQSIGSTTNFLQAELKAKYLFSPTPYSHLIFKTDLGYTLINKLKALPLSMRFFAGGINTIRGYPDSSIGPGRYLYTASAEYQHQIKDNWWASVFYDEGTATNHYGDSLYKGAGIGIIYSSYIGPIKVYFAQAINKPRKPYSIEFSIGPEF